MLDVLFSIFLSKHLSFEFVALQQSRVGVMFYFLVNTVENVNNRSKNDIWKFFTRDAEIGDETCLLRMPKNFLLFNPSRSWFRIWGIRFAGPCHRTANHGLCLVDWLINSSLE